ncbi:MAG: YbaY family lipoprotein [Myxococcota bacterium]
MKAVVALAVLALVALPSCRRADHGAGARAKAELGGAWLREPDGGGPGVEGFDLRADGSVGMLGILSLNGLAWNVSRDELVISTNTDRHAQPNPSRLRIASHEGDVLRLAADPPDFFAGTYRRSPVEHVSGVVTYLERIALPPDARVEVRLARGERLVARTLITPHVAVPIPFALSLLPEPDGGGSGYALEASIASGSGPLFATAAPLLVEAGATDVELLVRRAPEPR